MSKKKQPETGAEAKEIDEGRAAYMIAWRDRHIENLKETIVGLQEESKLLEALLAFALCRAGAKREDGARTLDIGKRELSEMLGAWDSALEADEDAYHLTFRAKKDGENGARNKEDQGG